MGQQRAGAPQPGLSDIGDLFRESWEIFQRRFATLIGLFVIFVVATALPLVAVAAAATFAGATVGKSGVVAISILGALASIYLSFRCFAAFLHAVIDERLALRDALEKGEKWALSLAWVASLTGFVIVGGYMLLIIPGIVFTVWFCFAQFVLVEEDVRGMGALLKSKEYVRGEWFNVFLRLLLIWAASAVLGAIPVVGAILSLVFFPYIMIFQYLIYRDLRRKKGDIPYPAGTADKMMWPGLALLGYVAVPVVLFSMIGLSVLGPLSQHLSSKGIAVKKMPQTPGGTSDDGFRVITFPKQENAAPPGTPDSPATTSPPGTESLPQSQSPSSATELKPEDIHVFIYAVNYTGNIKANGTVVRELEGKPDMQYNYNMFGKEIRYGTNQVDVDYAELPSHQDGLLRMHIKISRTAPGREEEILGEWHIEKKGRGTKSFTFDIPR